MRYRGLLVVAFAAISVAAFVPAGVHASAWIQDAQAQETEESRTKKALELFNQGQYVKAAKEYEKLITDFPDSRNMEDLEYYLVYSEWYAQKLRSARERAEKFLAARPKGKHAAHYQLSIASILQNQGKKQEAIAAYKKLFKDFPNTNESQSALWQYWNLVEKQFQFRVNQSWSEGEQPVVHGYLRNVDSVKFKLFKLDTSAVVKAVEAGKPVQSVQELVATTPASARTTVKEWTEEPNVGRQEWKSIEFKPEIKEAGIYMFEAMHDDIAMHVSIVVARYGLIVKSADNRLVSFAVDRRTGQPIEGMTVHVFDPNKKNEKGVTDAQGLAVFENAHQGAVVGIKDGELALSNAYHYGSGEEQKMVFFTDRPVYRPNNVVHWKGVFRAAKDGEFRNFSKTAVRVEIRDPRWNLVYQKDHTTDAMGTVDGDFTLGDEPSLGHYYIQSSIGGQGTFGVEEYRKPEYEVSVNFDGRPYTTGDSLKGAIAVMYYFGSPVVDADVQYTIYRRPYYKPYWRYWACDWWYDDDEDDDDGEVRHHKGGKHGYYYGWGESIYTGAGKTDKEGRMTFDFAPPKVEYDAVYTVIARVVDKSRREVTGQADAKMTRSKIELNISAGRYVYAPGDKVSIKVRVTDIDGKAVKNQPLKFRASTAEWHWRKAREIGEYEYGDFFSGEAKTDEQGMADFTFTAEDKKQGYIRFFATTEDDRGNEVTDDHWVWISDYSWSGTFDNLVGLDLVPDQDGYKLGDTAKVLMTSARKNVHVLVTTECEGIYSYKVVHMKGHTQMVEVPLTEKRMAPNVYVTATTLVKNEYLQKTKSLAVAPSHGLLNVKVTSDKKSYRPRETMEVTVEVTDDKGRPVQDAQLSLGIVDESIYAVQNEHMRDLRKFFWARRWNRVYTMTSMHFYDWGRGEFAGAAKEADAKAPGAPAPKAEAERSRGDEGLSKGKKNQAGAMAATETRSYFPDTMHWNPAAMTGADGKFSFKTTMPDSLTEWRTTVRAITADTKVGNTTHAVIARKEVIVRLTTPRFLTQNDTCTISGVVHNYRNDVDDVRVTLQAEGVEIVGDRDVTIKVPTGEDKRVDWKVIVKKAGTASFTAKAETPVESDAMRLDLPILPHGAMQYVAKAGTVEDKTAVKVSVPKTAIEEASELRITVSPSVASQVVDALEYLAGYPYGCVEQTMSRFLPTVTVARTLQKLNLPNKKLQEELPDMVNAGLQRLYNFQHSDGGWGWWEADQSNPYLTAYVVYGLAKAKEADFPVEQNVMERGIQALANLIELSKKRDVKEWRFGTQSDARMYMIFAMSEAGRRDAKLLNALYDERAELSNYSKGLLALCLIKAGDKEKASVVLANLDEVAKQGEAYCYWEGHQQRWHWMSNNIETTAFILKAIVANDPKDAKLHKIVRWLSANRHGNRWYSTKDTAAIVYALTDYVEASGELDADYTMTVKLNGKEFLSQRITKQNVLTFDGNKVLKASEFAYGDNEITIEKQGKGAVYYAVYLKYFNAVEDFKATEGTVKIERSYARVTYEGKERVTEPLANGAKVKSGDLIEVTLDITADGLHEYMMIEDPLPAGVEVQKEERFYGGWAWRGRHWGWWYSRLEARDERVCIASTYLNGSQRVTYLVRAETPGDFHVLPARAYNMYVPEMAGTSAESRLIITEK